MSDGQSLVAELAADLAGNRGLNPDFDRKLLVRAEDAGLNASAPPQQLWLDGWLVRFSPGKAKRARCINAVASGKLTVGYKLARAESVFDTAQLPMVVRITPFTRPAGLDAELAARGFGAIDDTRVMIAPRLAHLQSPALPPGLQWASIGHAAMAEAVGALRGSPLAQRAAHAERLASSPVPFSALAIKRSEDGVIVACGQSASEGDLVGLYDVFVIAAARGHGLARLLCTKLLTNARDVAGAGAKSAYLQVEADNHAARAVYFKLGFADGYGYHYRTR
jgi:GNAT superfamily N-acetyltransferase